MNSNDEFTSNPPYKIPKSAHLPTSFKLFDEDRISKLPDNLIVERILCHLPTIEAIRTSAISKRWRYLWTKVPHLDLTFYGGNSVVESSDLRYCTTYDDLVSIAINEAKEGEGEEEEEEGSSACDDNSAEEDEEDNVDEGSSASNQISVDKDDEEDEDLARTQFMDFVTGVLLLHESKLNSFKIGCEYSKEQEAIVSKWVRNVIIKNVVRLKLLFQGKPRVGVSCSSDKTDNETFPRELYMLPQHLYANSNSIKDMGFRCCNVSPRCHVNWTSLESLSLFSTLIKEDAIKRILAGCTQLKYLCFADCKGFDVIDTYYSSCLRTLVVDGFCEGGPELLSINACNNLESLVLTGNFAATQCRVMNIPISLAKVELTFRAGPQNGKGDEKMYVEYGMMVVFLLAQVHNVGCLRLGSWCIKVLFLSKVTIPPPPPLYCKYMELDTLLTNWELPGVVSMLESSRQLEQLIVRSSHISDAQLQLLLPFNLFQFGGVRSSFGVFNYYQLQLSMKNLKKVKILDSSTRRYNDGFLSAFTCFLLEHTSSPVEITISKAK